MPFRSKPLLDISRRKVIHGSLAAAFTSLTPFTRTQVSSAIEIPGKPGLRVLSERPLNIETPAHLLDDPVTPASRMFVRNNGIPPDTQGIDPLEWTLEIDGEACERPTTLTLLELQQRFETVTLQLQVECGGNGRAEFDPPVTGNQWTTGAIACPEWTGARLRDVLAHCGVKTNAVYVAFEGGDKHLSGDPKTLPISRGIPIHKAMEPETLIAWEMNGEPLPTLHGYPLRLVAGGWPGSVSGKWLVRLLIRDRIHDGPKMGGHSYRVPCNPVAPGAVVEEDDMCIIESMPVKSLITHPRSGDRREQGQAFEVRGHAWAGDARVEQLFTSANFGATWEEANIASPANRLAWQHWSTEVSLPKPGYYEIWARAVDENGRSQPVVLPAWNPRGYLNNACHRVALAVV